MHAYVTSIGIPTCLGINWIIDLIHGVMIFVSHHLPFGALIKYVSALDTYPVILADAHSFLFTWSYASTGDHCIKVDGHITGVEGMLIETRVLASYIVLCVWLDLSGTRNKDVMRIMKLAGLLLRWATSLPKWREFTLIYMKRIHNYIELRLFFFRGYKSIKILK